MKTSLWLIAAVFALAVAATAPPAHASSSTGMPWETPIATLATSLNGPVAFGIGLIGITVAGAMLIWGGEISQFAKSGVMLACVIGVHLAMLWAGHVLARLLGMARPEQIAIGFGGSQKTLMVGLDIGAEYYATMPLAMLPMVAYHVCQLLVDTLVADRLHQRGEAATRAIGNRALSNSSLDASEEEKL